MKKTDDPLDVAKSLVRLVELAPKMMREYTAAYAYGFESKVRRNYDHNPTEGQGRSTNVFKVTDPTGEIAADQETAREQVRMAGDEFYQAATLLDSAYSRLGRVYRSEYEPLREKARAGDKVPENIQRTYQMREKHLARIIDHLEGELQEVRRLKRHAS